MTAESNLLAEVIRRAPNRAKWFISTDSHEGMKYVFGDLVNMVPSPWEVIITESNKKEIAYLIEKHDWALKSIHMTVESEEHTVLFRSYDGMCTIILDSVFIKELNKDALADNLEILLD